jgi:glycogen phosphorylase
MVQLYDRYLGPAGGRIPRTRRSGAAPTGSRPAELWRTHERRRERLVSFVRRRVRDQLARTRGGSDTSLQAADEVLDPEVLTIGFARRFATYKRALLLFRDPDRLARILDDQERPVQVVIAGKAHPRDDAGKEVIRASSSCARRSRSGAGSSSSRTTTRPWPAISSRALTSGSTRRARLRRRAGRAA